MAGNSHLELLMAELLGDVGKVHDEIKALDKSIPTLAANFEATAELVSSKLNMQTALFVEAAGRYEKLLAALTEETKRNIIKASEAAKQEQLHDLRQTMQQAAQEAMQAVINERIGDSLAGIEKANKSLLLAAKSVNGAAAGVKATAKHWLWVAPVGAMIGALIVVATIWYTGRKAVISPASLTTEQVQNMELGSSLERVMPTLDPTTQTKLQAALRREKAASK